MAFLEPVTMLGVTSTASGKTTELQIHRACDKGFRRLFGNGSSVPSAGQISLTLTGRELVLRHEDGTVLARADVRASGQWLRAARARQTVMVYYGYGPGPEGRRRTPTPVLVTLAARRAAGRRQRQGSPRGRDRVRRRALRRS
ncbi:hypothetical protein LT493_24120 [Streptomyces tricolor]|nr:hypothetical protein [Streptomyces tricolor]